MQISLYLKQFFKDDCNGFTCSSSVVEPWTGLVICALLASNV